MDNSTFEAIIKSQQNFFKSGKSLNLDFRKKQLIKLKSAIKANEKAIMDALAIDIGKSEFESYATEIGIVYDEISLHLKKMSAWAKKKKVSTPLAAIPATSYTIAEPYGVTLIIAPWNYPFQLVVAPLVAAISTGNCAVIKPSEFSHAISNILEKIINETFEPNYIKVLNGDASVSKALLQQKFDFIFFTGSPRIGKIVMQAAAENLTPLVLELGGKSPCIVDKNIDIKQVAKRIIWGKLINAGQTCIAPDY
ncbi:MAG: aldehyde dehydrogenase family protein, partial [Ignavibacteria bacterium]|nr:aldehyde dehydrogenase family protein [Ignavibacteria bacterium]